MRQLPAPGDLTLPQTSALARLDRGGPATSTALAKQEQISPQSMGATLAELEVLGLVGRSSDPEDGRRVVMSLTAEGLAALNNKRKARVEHLAAALSEGFTASEIATLMAALPLIDRLANSL
jgi:DNA-binding MarR family transcriptional regulator